MDLFAKAYEFTEAKEAIAAGYLSLLHSADRKRRLGGGLQGPSPDHVRLEQLPGLDDRPASARGGHPGDQALRHELHRLALPQRYARDARAARA